MNNALFVRMPRCTEQTRSGRRKWRFRSELAALMVVEGFRRKTTDKKYTYECARCGGWHITSKPQDQRQE